MSLPFDFEPRPVDQIMPGRHQAYDTSSCWVCTQLVNYAELSPLDQAEYQISFMCPVCYQEACQEDCDEAMTQHTIELNCDGCQADCNFNGPCSQCPDERHRIDS